jgi:xylulokinase
MEAAVAALGHPGALEIVIGQLVNLFQNGEAVRMSKRTGEMVTFEELLEEVGPDAARYFFLHRSTDQTLDFDIGLAKQQSADNPVYFLPYMMGECSPHNDPNVRGAFLGLGMDTTRAQMAEAVFEGVSFGLKDSLEIARSLGIDIKKTKLSGGGAKSPIWQQILANILDLDIEILETEEGPSLGGAILAAVACGEYASVEDAARTIVKVKKTIKPQKELVEVYQKKYETFSRLYPAIKGIL